MTAQTTVAHAVRQINGISLETWTGGSGPALLVLHDYECEPGWYPFLDTLARHFTVTAVSHPGFGLSSIPDDLDTVDDLAYWYLDLLRTGETDATYVMGLGFGGWVAAEMAVRDTRNITRLILASAVGIKVGGRETRDIVDHFIMGPTEFLEAVWHDAQLGAARMRLPRLHNLDESTLTMLLRNRQTAALLGWKPFMHHPKLRQRLARVDVPTLVIWGASDRIVSTNYGRAYAKSIPSAGFACIQDAGHYPYLEKPDEFSAAALEFLLAGPTQPPSRLR